MIRKIALFLAVSLGVLVAGPSLEKGIALSANVGYRYGHIFRPSAPPGVPDTVDYLLPVHRTTMLLRGRFTPKDVLVLHYELREFRIYENSYRRFTEPVHYESEHHVKVGAGYDITPQVGPYVYYDYVGSRGQFNAHSVVVGSKLVASSETMFEPTYQFTRTADLSRHFAVLRIRQVLTPEVFLMLKNNYTATQVDTQSFRSYILDAYTGIRADDKTALHIGYRLYYDFGKMSTHGFWGQARRRLPGDLTFQARYRHYSIDDTEPEQELEPIASDGIELKVTRAPLLKRGTAKEYSGGLSVGLYTSNRGVKSFSLGLELSRGIPGK